MGFVHCAEKMVTFVVFLYDAFSSSTVPFRFIAISFALEPLFSSKHPGDLEVLHMMEQEHPHRIGNSGLCSLCREDGDICCIPL